MTGSVKYFIGIDNGKSGGISAIDINQGLVFCVPMPIINVAKGTTYDVQKIIEYLDTIDNKIVFIEEAHTMFGNGIKSAFTNGELYGIMKGILIAKKIPFEIVKARTWQKELFKGQIVNDTKGASVEFCIHKYPNVSFTSTERSNKLHDGMTDSLCIANYGVIKYNDIKKD